MKISTIKYLIENHSKGALENAENELLDELPMSLEIEGDHEGEKLTHILAAIWCHQYIETHQVPINMAIREYSVKVRKSIS